MTIRAVAEPAVREREMAAVLEGTARSPLVAAVGMAPARMASVVGKEAEAADQAVGAGRCPAEALVPTAAGPASDPQVLGICQAKDPERGAVQGVRGRPAREESLQKPTSRSSKCARLPTRCVRPVLLRS